MARNPPPAVTSVPPTRLNNGAGRGAAPLLIELAEECEKALQADRKLDAAIGSYLASIGTFSCFGCDDPLRFTASLDAANTLVPEGHIVMVANTGVDDREPDFTKASALVGPALSTQTDYSIAATMPLALCAASLRARADQVQA